MRYENTTGSIKEGLFEAFVEAAHHTLAGVERQFGVKGLLDQVFGQDNAEIGVKEKLRNTPAWKTLSQVYDYAVHGIDPENILPDTLLQEGSDVLELLASEDYGHSQNWDDIIAQGNGRQELDFGSPVEIEKIALLANVDIRTVRNAVSSGELIAFKAGARGKVFIENAPARHWLRGRRGFKPTVNQVIDVTRTLNSITTPQQFGAFLKGVRKNLYLGDPEYKPKISHQSATPQAIELLESGVFVLPLDAVFPVADFYQLDRKSFLRIVMNVFFNEQMQMLSATHNSEET